MPYKLIKNIIYHKKGGKWSIKQRGKSVASAKRALALLQGLESGSITPAQVKARRQAKKSIAKRKAKANKYVKRTLKLKKGRA